VGKLKFKFLQDVRLQVAAGGGSGEMAVGICREYSIVGAI